MAARRPEGVKEALSSCTPGDSATCVLGWWPTLFTYCFRTTLPSLDCMTAHTVAGLIAP